jgi:serine/threonine protein kinase
VPAATPAAAAPALAAPATAAVAPAPLAAPAVAVKPAAPAVAVATEEVSTVANGETERLADALRSSQPAPAAPARQPLSLEIGSVLGRCLLLEKVGQGAAGMVFRGIHRSFNIPVAVKVLRANSLEVDAAAFQCFRREAQLLAKLNHPNIVRVWDFEDDPEFPYLVLEYVEGFSLAELIQQSGRLQAHRAVRIVRQTAMGLEAALQLGIIHRDVKPGNILLTRDGNVKLADLGLAVLVADLTGTGQRSEGMAGTAAYMSPEQAASGATVDHRSDIYALGATFYHMLTGHLPFTGRSAMEMLLKHAREPLVPPSEVVPGLDERISRLVVRMMAKKPQDRVQTYAELLAELDQVHQNDDSSGTVNPPSTSSRANPKRGSSIWSMFRNRGGGNRSDGSQ